MQHMDGNAVLESFAYTYDKENNILSTVHVNNMPENGKKINETRVYTYDDYYNLSSSTKTDHLDGDSQLVTTYTYDQVGNRASQTTDGVTTTYTYNGLNQLLSKTGPDGTVNYTYDARGNQILEQGLGTSTAMEYAVTGEMTSLTEYSGETATLTQSNVYDHNGIRIRKTEDGTSRDYYYDSGVAAFTMDGNDISTANILTPQGAVAGSYRDSIYHTYLKDQQGSTTSIVKEDGTLSAAYDYSDFGETTEITESGFDNQVCYTGGIYDDETGLYYLNARYYDPELGRFISQDTYRGMPEESDQWHLYAYCANNPINYVDPSGHVVVRRWMVSTPIDMIACALGVGLYFAPIKALCKSFGKAFSKVSFTSNVFKFANKIKRFGNKIGTKIYSALRKVPGVKKRVKKTIIKKVEGFLYTFAATQVIYKFSGLIVKNIDLCLSIGGFTSAVVDYVYDRKLNNVVYRF